MEAIMDAINRCAHTFSNGITVVNTTPHDITFLDVDETRVIVPSDKACILNAKAVEKQVSDILVTTEFVGTDEGRELIKMIYDTIGKDTIIIGSIIAMNAYVGDVKGMIPVPGFERVPPDQKRMRCDKFNVAVKWKPEDYIIHVDLNHTSL